MTPKHWSMMAGAILLFMPGCKTVGRIRSAAATVVGVQDAGAPATLATGESKQMVAIPAESPVSVTRIEAVPATANTPFQPAREVFAFTPLKETRWETVSSTLRADTGTVDTSVAMKKIEVAERRWLLFAAIGCGIAGLLSRSILPAWPAISNGLLAAAVASGLAWKLSDVPWWLWLLVLGVVVVLILGYKRAEWDKDKDGIPDALQRKTPPTNSAP